MSESFTAASTTDEVLAGVRLDGRTALVTGASSGLGLETSRALASAGARVVMVARNGDKLNAAIDTVRTQVAGAQLDPVPMDLADLDSVRHGASEVLSRHSHLDLLINNAGVMACPLTRTAQGFELQLGTNHIGHFLFTCLLAPALLSAAPARIVNVSSAGHHFADVDFNDPNYHHRRYEKWQAYGQSKTANILFSVALEQRLGTRGVHSYALHPGMIVTELGRHLEQADIDALSARSSSNASNRPRFKSIAAGAATTVWAATSEQLQERGGLYLHNCQIAAVDNTDSGDGVAAYAIDPERAERLWQLSEQLVNQSFTL